MNANEKIVLDIVEKSGSSFMTGMKILSKEKRNAMFAVYAFCRLIDDIADEPAPLEEKKKALKIWRNDIDTLYRDEVPLSNPVATVLAPIVKKFNLPKDEFFNNRGEDCRNRIGKGDFVAIQGVNVVSPDF